MLQDFVFLLADVDTRLPCLNYSSVIRGRPHAPTRPTNSAPTLGRRILLEGLLVRLHIAIRPITSGVGRGRAQTIKQCHQRVNINTGQGNRQTRINAGNQTYQFRNILPSLKEKKDIKKTVPSKIFFITFSELFNFYSRVFLNFIYFFVCFVISIILSQFY